MRQRPILLMLLCTGLLLSAISAPNYGDRFDLVQPDGSMVPVMVWGDEFFQRVESPDGYTLVRNKESGWICFAELAADSSDFVPTDRIYQPGKGLGKTVASSSADLPQHIRLPRSSHLRKHREVRQRLLGEECDSAGGQPLPAPPTPNGTTPQIMPLQGAKPVIGSFAGLTILIDFSDQAATVPVDSIKDFVNKRNYTGFKNNGSVRDFYYDVSGGKVDYQNAVTTYYRAKKAKTYYDSRSASFGDRAQELITEALAWLKNDGFDFTTLSTYTSGTSTRKYIQAINVLYAGAPTQGWSEGLWPHQGRMNNILIGSVYAAKYQMSNIGSSLAIGTFCHENGHMVFSYPDLYDYGGESQGVGVYCLMCATGTTNPIPPCAYLRDFSGWDAVTDITDMPPGTVLSQLPATINATFVFRNKSNAKEMFYLEARRRIGRYKTLPDSGFLIWHVDRNGSNDNEQKTSSTHYLVSLEQADNAYHLENNTNSGRAGDLYRKGYKDVFDDNTSPNAHWWNGSNSGLKINNISNVADTMSFSLGAITGTQYTIIASASEHGSLVPSGRLSVAAGSSIKFAVHPDSGYQVDAITVDEVSIAIVDTVHMSIVNANHTVKVAFGSKGALGIMYPEEGVVLYAGDTAAIAWRVRGVAVQGIDVSYSIDGGKTFITIKTGLPATDTAVAWIVPVVECDSCQIRVADTDGNPQEKSARFSVRKKPSISIASTQLALTVERGKSKQHTFSITNNGSGDLRITATTAWQIRKILINELSIGSDANAPDAVELLNEGVDIDMSGWQLIWDDNKTTSGSYTFPRGFVFEGGSTFLISDLPADSSAGTAYTGLNVQWLYSDSLTLAITLLDAAGSGVDFVKSSGIPITPPQGTGWSGNGISLCNSFVSRTGLIDRDSAADWACSETGTLRKLNTSQTISNAPPLLATAPLSVMATGGTKVSLTLTLDAARIEVGSYTDMLVIYHNDPSKPSPLRIPCTITVSPASKVVTMQKKYEGQLVTSRFIAAPNPVPSGEKVFFGYQPSGDERSGTLVIYNSIGNCLSSEKVDFGGLNIVNRNPLHFSWQPRSRGGYTLHSGTYLARLVVKHADGSQEVFPTKIGLR